MIKITEKYSNQFRTKKQTRTFFPNLKELAFKQVCGEEKMFFVWLLSRIVSMVFFITNDIY